MRDLRLAAVLTVLHDRYIAETRSDKGDFAHKINLVKSQLSEVLDRVQVRWGPFGNSAEPSTLFSCKLRARAGAWPWLAPEFLVPSSWLLVNSIQFNSIRVWLF